MERVIPDLLRLTLGRSTGHEPDWVILDLHGNYPAGGPANALRTLMDRGESLQALLDRLERIGRAGWVRGVLVRVGDLTAGLATAHAIGRALERLAARKRVVGYLQQVSMRSLLVTAGLQERVAPESAEVQVPGFAVEQLFFGSFLRRHGIGFENLRIGEYKAALTPLSDERMDEHNREQLAAYLESIERTWLRDVGGSDDALLARRPTTAQDLLDAGVLTRVAYDDEIVTVVERDLGRALALAMPDLARAGAGRRRDGVALVAVRGAIVSGRSRPAPPLPFPMAATAGSDTVVAALRKAERDEHVKAIVLHVDSGGGSAMASDLICRAVRRCSKPVVAVMGEVAASGGYYVLAQADHVVADPYTVTGSIGVVIGKPVLSEFDERHGFNPQAVGREPALSLSPHRAFSAEDREWAERIMADVYARFVARVAAGRNLERARVDQIGRGRIWSGADAREIGLVDELGDLHDGVAAARRLAGLPDDAPLRPVSAGLPVGVLPTMGQDAAATLGGLWPFASERVLTWMDRPLRVR